MDFANIQAGDILVVRGTGFFSNAILRLTGNTVSHAGLVVSTSPVILITEALWRVKTRPIQISISAAEHAYILQPKNLDSDKRSTMIFTASTFSADGYGVWDIVMQLLNLAFRTTWFTETDPWVSQHPICSAVAANAYASAGLTFGKRSWKSLTPADLYNFAKSNPDKYAVFEVK